MHEGPEKEKMEKEIEAKEEEIKEQEIAAEGTDSEEQKPEASGDKDAGDKKSDVPAESVKQKIEKANNAIRVLQDEEENLSANKKSKKLKEKVQEDVDQAKSLQDDAKVACASNKVCKVGMGMLERGKKYVLHTKTDIFQLLQVEKMYVKEQGAFKEDKAKKADTQLEKAIRFIQECSRN